MLGLELWVCKDVYLPPSGWKFDFDATSPTEIRHFDSFLLRIAETKQKSKGETLEDWLESEKERKEHGFSVTELKVDYYSIVGSIDNDIQIYENLRVSHVKTIGRSVDNFTTFMTENGAPGHLFRTDRYARVEDVLVVVEGTSSPLLLRPSGTKNEYEYLGHCHYKEFEYTGDIFSNQVLKEFIIV